MVVTDRLTVLLPQNAAESHHYLVVTTLYFSLIVSVIFIFGELGTRICLAFNTIVK